MDPDLALFLDRDAKLVRCRAEKRRVAEKRAAA
jgi:hypothetical protein